MRLFLILFLCAWVVSCARTSSEDARDVRVQLSSGSISASGKLELAGNTGSSISSLEGTLDQAALRRRFRGLIHRADYYALKNEEEAALKQYTSIYQKLGRDPVIMKKIGTLSYQVKNWDGAYEFLRDLPFDKLSTQERQMYLNSILNKSAPYEEKAGDIARTPLSEENRPYWEIALICTEKPQECIPAIESYSGTEIRAAKLKEISDNFDTISPDPSYRDALLAGTFFAHKQYAPAYALSHETVSKRPKYFAVLKIWGISAYELGDMEAAKELESLSATCRELGLLFAVDGARLAVGLTSPVSNASIEDIARLTDAFYIGGTKMGAVLGEAIVINHPTLARNFRHHIKQNGALLAKWFVLATQFDALIQNSLYETLGRQTNARAQEFITGLKSLGISFLCPPEANLVYPILENTVIRELERDFGFYVWSKVDDYRSAIRLVTAWDTTSESIADFLKTLTLLQK